MNGSGKENTVEQSGWVLLRTGSLKGLKLQWKPVVHLTIGGRELQKRGFKVKIIHAQFVKPYVKSNKNDAIDAEAICEAMSRPNMRFVSVKSSKRQDIQSIHRIRDKLMVQKASKANQIRGLVSEYGLVAPVGINKLREAIPL